MLAMTSNIQLPALESSYPYITAGLRIAVILAGAFVLSWILRKSVRRAQERLTAIMESHGDMATDAIKKRTATIGGILRGTSVAAIWTLAAVMCLREAGFDIGPLLAGAGIAGVAIGFGAQSLVRDVISGAFMLLEDHIRVGDVVRINGTGGLVEQINLRTTVLRSMDGTVHIFPNGSINTLANMTRDFSFYIFDLRVAYKEDTDRVVEAVKEVAAELQLDPDYGKLILEPLEVLGLDQFADSAVVIKARIKTKPISQWKVGRELNRRFKKRFDELGIEIPFPQMSLSVREGLPPAGSKGQQSAKEED